MVYTELWSTMKVCTCLCVQGVVLLVADHVPKVSLAHAPVSGYGAW